jgi:hypothetical protein
MAAGAKRPGAKKTQSAAPATPETATAVASAESAAEAPKAEGERDAAPETSQTPAPPVKGLGMAKGARPPGKRN